MIGLVIVLLLMGLVILVMTKLLQGTQLAKLVVGLAIVILVGGAYLIGALHTTPHHDSVMLQVTTVDSSGKAVKSMAQTSDNVITVADIPTNGAVKITQAKPDKQ